MMTKAEATAEVFVTALKSLSKSERDAVLARIAQEKDLARDLIDLALIAQRSDEPSRPFREYLEEKRRRKAVSAVALCNAERRMMDSDCEPL